MRDFDIYAMETIGMIFMLFCIHHQLIRTANGIASALI